MDFNNLTADCLYYFVSRAYLASTSLLKKELIAKGAGEVKPAYLGVLMILWEQDGLQASELGKKVGLEPSSMTGMIDRMERDKLIIRQSDPHDRRALRIHLTREGENTQKPVMKVVDEALASVFDGISDEQIKMTQNVLKNLIENIQMKKNKPIV
jgi:DNA-binding MarR family transcriptional regulator